MIAVSDVVFICYALDNAETLLKTLCKLICCAFKRSTIKAVVTVFSLFPLRPLVVQLLHNFKTEFFALFFCELFADKAVNALPKTCITE